MNKNDELICHYTSIQSLKSILSSEEIWATRYDDLDDFSENRFLPGLFPNVPGLGLIFGAMQCLLYDYPVYILSFSKHHRERNKYGNLTLARYFGFSEWCGIIFNKEKLQNHFWSITQGYGHLASGDVFYLDPEKVSKCEQKDYILWLYKSLETFFRNENNFEKFCRDNCISKNKKTKFKNHIKSLIDQCITDLPKIDDNELDKKRPVYLYAYGKPA